MGLKVIILAAGKGKRMESDVSKILHPLGGVSLLERVVKTAKTLKPDEVYVVYGNGGSEVRDKLPDLPVHWIKQEKQLGTGHAVLQAIPQCQEKDKIIVLYGDVPLITSHTLTQLLKETPKNGLGLIVTELDNPAGFGRIIRNTMGNIIAIIEEQDATHEQRHIKEINTGIITATAHFLKRSLPLLKNNNKQQEYYLTDIVALATHMGHPVGGVMAHCREEVCGVNDRWQLAKLERYYQYTQAKTLCYAGVTVADPHRIDIRGSLKTGTDIFIDINFIAEGQVTLGSGCQIGPNVTLKNTHIDSQVKILGHCVIEGSIIKTQATIGPFTHLRPGTTIEKQAKVGNFVETKNTQLGARSKANHLSYLGDAQIGQDVNIGAGTITCNYDGCQKWPTVIGDAAFIGSNTALIAPLKIGNKATIGAGSSISQNAPPNALTLARAEQQTHEEWKRPQDREKNQE